MSTHRKPVLLLCSLACAFALAGCIKNPDATPTPTTSSTPTTPGNAGEPAAPKPPAATAQHPTNLQTTPNGALAAFARLYVNWSYRTLTASQQTLAAMAVGPARLAEQQAAAASAADSTIARGHVWNHGQIVSIAADQTHPEQWVIVTREQTGGSNDYQGLPAAYHVTLAQLAHLPHGYAVNQWQPQT
jgi:hypothetical protein